ncbi:MAG: hypothetical protein M1829_002557 [Trizodia sp. TS-e1964]|nr:MAG: hypothetical protein M1829_002557 [Trizodia sp. TS-e1964]
MSSLRRRILGNYSNETSRETTPPQDERAKPAITPKASTKQIKGRKRRNWLIFTLGGLSGVVVAALFAQRNDVLSLQALEGFNLDAIFDAIPSGVLRDAKEISKKERDTVNYDSFSVGLQLLSEGVRAHHPVVMIPGVISTGLESWGTQDVSRQYFRKRLWGSWTMMRALVMDKANWKQHIMLDKKTGLDPPRIKLRAAQGFDATDFFVSGFWLWNKILENLATIGYDPTNSYTAAYDWRLAYSNLEVRDQYFSRLKNYIETGTRLSQKKAVIVSHSMGSQVFFYFLHWVQAPGKGDGGFDWVENNIDSWINISGSMLGALKGLPAVLSGEMKDTAQLNAFAVYGLEKFLSREERLELFRAMPGISSLLPKGGNAVWGNATWAPDDLPGQTASYGTFLNFRESNSTQSPKNLTVEESMKYLLENSDDWYSEMIHSNYSHGIAHTNAEKNGLDPRKWINPLETALPFAPSLKIYCFYGVGKPAERSYYYREDLSPFNPLNVTIDTGFTKGLIDHGVILGEGDGTVSLLSIGYMCARGWKKIKRFNPAGAKIVVVEMPHEPDRFSPRGGPNTGDHVDILGRQSLNDLILRVAGGKGDSINETIVSNIMQYSENVKIYED